MTTKICSRCKIKKSLAVDHDHNTNTIRGLLCSKCNLALGGFEDSIDRLRAAIRYLEGTVS